MSLEAGIHSLAEVYSRDIEKVIADKREVETQVENLKASIVELKLTEVDNEFSDYPAALSLELRQLNNKLAVIEENNRLVLSGCTLYNVHCTISTCIVSIYICICALVDVCVNDMFVTHICVYTRVYMHMQAYVYQ